MKNKIMSKTRLRYLLKEMFLKKGIKNLLNFTDVVSAKGLKLVDSGSLTPTNLQSSLKNKDNGFFKSNKISRKSFYKEVVNLIKKETLKQKKEKLSEVDRSVGVSIFGSQFHFGRGDNVRGNKIKKEKKESFIEKFFWQGFLQLAVAILAGVFLYLLFSF